MVWKSIWELCRVILCFWLLLRSFTKIPINILRTRWTQFWAGSSMWPNLNQGHWTRLCQEVFQRILFFGAWYLYVPPWSALLLSVVIINHHGPTSARSLQLHHSQTTLSFSDAQLLGTSSCRPKAELMSKSKHLLNFETINLMKPEVLWCASALYSVCAPPKAHLVEDTLLNSRIKSHKIRTKIPVGPECLLFASEVYPSVILLWIHPQTLVVTQLSFKVRRPKKTSYKIKID